MLKPDCACGPWIKLSHCGVGTFDPASQALVSVACPSRFCSGLVRLVDGKISVHDGWIPGRCPWIGTRVVDDRSEFPSEQVTTVRNPHR